MKHLLHLSILLGLVVATATDPLVAAPQTKPRTESKAKQVDKKKSASNNKKQKKGSVPANAKSQCVFSDIEMRDINGKKVKLSHYKGKVVLIVNVASKCGFTGQYGPLQSVYEKFGDQGLEVIAFPCNQFGKQEPHDEEHINHFCKKRFGIAFDIFSKVDVKGKKQAKLFQRLTKLELEPAGKGDIKWNFEKFVIGRDGKPIARFRSDVHPNSELIMKTVKKALAVKYDRPTPDGSQKGTKANQKVTKPVGKTSK